MAHPKSPSHVLNAAKDDAGKEYFFHQRAVYGEGIDNLREGDRVEFEVGEGPKGPRAESVRRTST